MSAADEPVVTVVVATYDRPRALRAALTSLVAQRFEHWEAIVVGDACDSRTGDVVEGFGDGRLRLVQLARNVGEQSGPNNVGAAFARAELVAYLNHDDLWFPDHLTVLLDALRARQADLVFSANANVLPGPDDGSGPVVIDGMPHGSTWAPWRVDRAVPASSWLVRRSLLHDLGGWRSAWDCRTEPSQDLLWRARRRGARLAHSGALTVVTFPSGLRSGSYVGDHATAQEQWLRRLAAPETRAELLAAGAASEALTRRTPAGAAERLWRHTLRGAAAVGIDPRALDATVRRRRVRGAFLHDLRRNRGLPDLRVRDPLSSLWFDEARATGPIEVDRWLACGTGGTGSRALAGGWSQLEDWGVWSEGPWARLVLEVGSGTSEVTIELALRANHSVPGGSQTVHVSAGSARARWVLDGEGTVTERVSVDVEGRRFVVVELDLPDAGPAGADQRNLAVGLERLRVHAG